MNISFQKISGDPKSGIAFFWKLAIETSSSSFIKDHFIPELFFDYLFVKEGKVRCIDQAKGTKITLPQQTLKTIHTRAFRFHFSMPLVLYGARLPLKFAESFWEEIKANCFWRQSWVEKDAGNLESFRSQVVRHIESHGTQRWPYPMFSSGLEESSWLVHFSARHKRRLYASTFGLSRKQLQNIRNVHSFLEQTCDFASENPRIIRHVNPDVFHDQAHLNHTFKKMTGFSPVEYFEAGSILQDHLMSASYNENSGS